MLFDVLDDVVVDAACGLIVDVDVDVGGDCGFGHLVLDWIRL